MRLLLRNLLVLTLLVIAYPAKAVIVSPDLEVFTIANVGNTPVTVNLQNSYINAIPVCTYNIESATPVPAVVRIDNITANTFDVYLQKASSALTAESPNDVHCVISEEGEFTIGGLHWEARSKDATFTNRRGAFGNASDQVTNITGIFSNPIVVLHQVITSNDPAWSTSWAYRGTGSSQNPPVVGNIYVGKHVAADTNTARAAETVGYIVLETASGTVNGVAFDAALGADTIDGVDNAGNTYTAPTLDYRHGIASQNAMDGGDGGWAVLFGLAPLAGDAITVAIDEDDIADTERAHTTEQVAYWLLEPVDVADLNISIDDGNSSYTPGATVQYTAVLTNNGPNDASNVNLVVNAPADTTISSWTCAGVACPTLSGSGNINQTAATLTNGDTLTYTIDVAVASSSTGVLALTATASNMNVDPITANDSATDSNTQSSSADINVTNTDGTLVYLPGATSTYTVQVSNIGPSDASNVAFSYSTPAGTMTTSWTCAGANCPSISGSGAISENILSLAESDSVAYTVNVAVSFFYSGPLTTTASASASEADPNGANDSADDVNSDSPDTDGDGVPDAVEVIQGTDPNDPADVLDTDNDGVPDFVELSEGTDPSDSISFLDRDGDGSPDYVERGGDKEMDGVGDEFESSITDTDGDLIADDLDSDADGDGIADLFEGTGDSDGDGIPDFLDRILGATTNGGDSDSDGINDATECPQYPTRCPDSDGDRIPNYADNDDDNDGLLTALELGSGGAASPADSDSDLVADYLEPNNRDTDGDSNFDYLDGDDDGDGLATMDELDANNDTFGDALFPDDLDNEGIADYLDRDNGDGTGTDIAGSGDSDGDGMSDATECPQAPLCADSDGDGIPNYMIGSADSDGDGILDTIEIGGDPTNPTDSDGDSVPDYLEGNTTDTDGDGVMDYLDDDDDGDGFPTIDEVGAGGALAAADSDGDGKPDYLSFSSVKTGVDGGAGSMGLFMGLFIWLIVLLKATIKLVHKKELPLRRQQ